MAIKFGRPIEMRDAPRRDVLLPAPGSIWWFARAATAKPNGRAGWCGKTFSPPTT